MDDSIRKTSVLSKARLAVANSGMTYEQVGIRMGYPQESARQSVWQFLQGENPSLSMLRKLAKALDTDVKELL